MQIFFLVFCPASWAFPTDRKHYLCNSVYCLQKINMSVCLWVVLLNRFPRVERSKVNFVRQSVGYPFWVLPTNRHKKTPYSVYLWVTPLLTNRPIKYYFSLSTGIAYLALLTDIQIVILFIFVYPSAGYPSWALPTEISIHFNMSVCP